MADSIPFPTDLDFNSEALQRDTMEAIYNGITTEYAFQRMDAYVSSITSDTITVSLTETDHPRLTHLAIEIGILFSSIGKGSTAFLDFWSDDPSSITIWSD